ncbi:hypothetical protein ACIPJK_39610 [Streptomyces roseus]|uniref:hypothetical protein n=1 Tax=Streptomyces roseus TaxID=66430 RepID=UPI00381A9656
MRIPKSWLIIALLTSIMLGGTPPAVAEVWNAEVLQMNRNAAEHWLDPVKEYVRKCETDIPDAATDPYLITEIVQVTDRGGKKKKQWLAGSRPVPAPELLRYTRSSYFGISNDFPEDCYKTEVRSEGGNPENWQVTVNRYTHEEIIARLIVEGVLPVIDVALILEVGVLVATITREGFRVIMSSARSAMAGARATGGPGKIAEARRLVLQDAGVAASGAKAGGAGQKEIEEAATKAAQNAAKKLETPHLPGKSNLRKLERDELLHSRFVNNLTPMDQRRLIQMGSGIVAEYDPFPLANLIGHDPAAKEFQKLQREHVRRVVNELVRTNLDFEAAAELARKLAAERGVATRQGGAPPGGMFRPGGSPTRGQKGAGYDSSSSGASSSSLPNTSGMGPSTQAETGNFFNAAFKSFPDVLRMRLRDKAPVGRTPRADTIDHLKKVATEHPNPHPDQPRVIDGVSASLSAIKATAGEYGARTIDTVFKDPSILDDLLRPNSDRAAHGRIAEAERNYWLQQDRQQSTAGTKAALNASVQDRIAIQQGMGDLLRGLAADAK